jgi:hypothetical protein
MRLLEARHDVVVRVAIVGGDLNNPHDEFVDSKGQRELMSIPTKEQAGKFLAPLKGSLAILLLHDTQAKAKLSRFILRCASLQSIGATILDADAFYCTNMERFAEDIQTIKGGEVLLLPERGFGVSSLLPLLSSKRQILIIDDLNSLYSLASDVRKSLQLTILMRLLSHNAQMNGSWAIATAYRAELDRRQNAMKSQRSLTALGDLLIDTEPYEDSIKLRSSVKGHWTDGEFIP